MVLFGGGSRRHFLTNKKGRTNQKGRTDTSCDRVVVIVRLNRTYTLSNMCISNKSYFELAGTISQLSKEVPK